jgi:hypothetical protein
VLLIFVLGLFPRPILKRMEPSVQKFTRDFGRRVAEPDGPAHLYGTMPARDTAQMQKNLDDAARGAQAAADALKAGGQ